MSEDRYSFIPFFCFRERLVWRNHQYRTVQPIPFCTVSALLVWRFLHPAFFGWPLIIFQSVLYTIPLWIVWADYEHTKHPRILVRSGWEIVSLYRKLQGSRFFHHPSEIPVQKGTVQYQSVDRKFTFFAVQIIRGNQSTGRMCHQQYFVIPLFPNNGKGSIEVCKILFQAFAEEGFWFGSIERPYLRRSIA